MRRVLRHRRRQGRRLLPHARPPGRRPRHHHDRGPGERRDAASGAAGVHRGGCDAVRLLHERNGHLGRGAPGARHGTGRGRRPRRACRQPLPLWRVWPRDPCGATRRRSRGWKGRSPCDEQMNLEERIRIEPDGSVTAFSGKIEFGQGIRTAFAQLVANELDLPVERVRVVLGDTAQVPFDFGTFGSNSVAQEAPALRLAAAFARRSLIGRAAERLGIPATRLDTRNGTIGDGDGKRVGYAELVREAPLAGAVPDDEPLLPPERWRHIGEPLSRVEARDIVTGRARYTADVRLEGLARGAIARPPARGARVTRVDDRAARAMPGVIAVVHDGDVVGVVAEREEQARAAADALDIAWEMPKGEPSETQVVPMRTDGGTDAALASATLTRSATYTLPSIASASIGPSAAVADVRSDGATIDAGTHRPFGLRDAVAGRVGLPQDR